MLNLTAPSSRIISRTLCVVLANAAIPFGIPKLVSDAWPKSRPAPAKAQPKASRILTGKEMRTLQGRSGENPYLAGQSKWDVMLKGVDLMTGNDMTSATDLDFEGGFGIPVNVTRSYSANCPDEGPFGKGWTLSADVRSTAGGLLKGPSAPIRSVPTNMTEQPPKEYDPNSVGPNGNKGETGSGGVGSLASTSPVQGVTVTDAGGTAETVQKDVDGVLTTPPWDDNVSNAVYQIVSMGGSYYQVLLSNVTTTIDGTQYTYGLEGSYPNGTLPYNSSQMNPVPSPTPANVLKVTSAVDRQGNQTNYSYGSSYVAFNKSDGQTSEHPLVGVSMPNGHILTFTWGNVGASSRIFSVCDGTSPASAPRTVLYGYNQYTAELSQVTSPQGKVTQYGYSQPYVPTSYSNYALPVAGNLLSQITDPRGLTTTIHYQMGITDLAPYGVSVPGVLAYEVDDPNGVRTVIQFGTGNPPPVLWPIFPYGGICFVQMKDVNNNTGAGTVINGGTLEWTVTGTGSDPILNEYMWDSAAQLWPIGQQKWQKSYDVPTQTLSLDDEM